ncbi:molybdate transport system regulatory protein [Lachnotalea glycerini]|jgi:molybdate transport system regulatory protein|uniref:Molybdate transport system regulatory protein n=1 Tax=Lachnotalea glycerini TaxID=1763509 RepID=A0A318ERR9_9FIRM|nr:LysR family transcriptional regulator [Lachnotalea glycerini]PXV93438.1 molybdate transport system regulatory protein [Lachnotalea glycerini]
MKTILQSHIRLVISGTDDFSNAFGPGTAQLLLGVEKMGSLNQIAKDIGMSYSKAWKSIRETEKALGVALIERNGVNGSSLTKEGEEILALFQRAHQAAHNAVQQVLIEEAEKKILINNKNKNIF